MSLTNDVPFTRIMAIDPSGNYTEGKGVTGYVEALLYEDGRLEYRDIGTIRADKFPTKMAFWEAHMKLTLMYFDELVIEDYRLYNHQGSKAAMQTGSRLETPRLLGLLEFWAANNKVPITWQMASQTTAYNEDVLVARNILKKQGSRYFLNGEKTNDHIRSALKHLHRYLANRKEKK